MPPVDFEEAKARAQQVADRAVLLSYPPRDRNSEDARALWLSKFNREFFALVARSPTC